MKNVALHNLGCKVNAYETDIMQQMLEERGYHIVPFDSEADIYIINTCTVTNIADRKSRQMIHRAKSRNPQAVVVAVGCYVQTGGEEVMKDPCIDLAIGNDRKNDLVEILEEYLEKRDTEKEIRKSEICDISRADEYEEMKLTHTAEHTRAYIKIQDGCNQFCSYCIIPYARGRVRSRKPENILDEIEGLAARGYKEVVLTGIHISSYGTDFGENKLMELLERIQDIEGIRRIRLGSLEPRFITPDVAYGLAKLDKVCPHFHLSLQSGCDETLRRMNRHYTTEEYGRSVALLRDAYEHPAITTDVIVGFPGETQEEFEQTYRFLEGIGFYEMHIFKYSRRQGTRAADMDGQVPDTEKTARSAGLISLSEEMSVNYRRDRIGESDQVLFEGKKEIGGTSYWVGYTENYVKAALPSAENLSNRILNVKTKGFLSNDILICDNMD